MYVEHVGKSIIINHKTGNVGVFEFIAEGWYGINRHKIIGDVFMNEDDRKNKVSVAKV